MEQRATKRIHYLDSIRGIAALMVVMYHYIGWNWKDELSYKVAAIFFNGSDAVSFFFVLSGFVLSYSYIQSDRKIRFGNYVYRRILRLYPAFILNILLLYFYVNKHLLSWDTLYDSFILGRSPYVLKELAMVLNAHSLYMPGWTLQIEMIYSFIILLLILVFRWKKEVLILFFIGSFFIGAPGMRLYMTHFIWGVCFAYYYPKLIKMDYRKTKLFKFRWLVYPLILFLFSLRQFKAFLPGMKKTFDLMWSLNIRWEHFSGLAALMILILIAMSKPAQAFLENKILLYLGKISYSIYLIHWLLVLVVMEFWDVWANVFGDGYFRFYAMLGLFISLTILLANVMYHYVEKPFIDLSKRKAIKLNPKT